MRILDYRNDETIRHQGVTIEGIMRSVGRANNNLTIISRETQSDSRSMKILTSIGMVYLPANLVAVSTLFHAR